jgi:heme exporter protein C
VAFSFLFLTLHLAAMRNEILRRRVRALQMLQARASSSEVGFSSEVDSGSREENASRPEFGSA